jgi:hypothetical protein
MAAQTAKRLAKRITENMRRTMPSQEKPLKIIQTAGVIVSQYITSLQLSILQPSCRHVCKEGLRFRIFSPDSQI